MKLKKVTISGVNSFKLPVLDSKEQEELFWRYKNGDEKAKTTIIQGNLRLVLSVLKKFKNRNENMDDLFQVGCIGLLKAVNNFDPTHNVKFSTYAVPMIIGEIKRYLRDNNSIRISRSLKNLGQDITRAKEKLSKDKEKEPTLEEIADELSISSEEVVLAMNANNTPMSLHEPVFSDSTEPLLVLDQIQDEKETFDSWIENLALKEALDKLPEKKRELLILRFFQGKTQEEVSSELNISQAQVSRLEKTSLKALKKSLAEKQGESVDGSNIE
ncbi:RNA polymerase sporulation sigma factor SigG [Natranaerofaba carboxydovora]|uniref:RNA polymerase sporulation sigma factor SigG n=1 Tax=Natranaerofaba carboxydovora TaxID=2742683 RepID=UPI0030B7F9F6